MEPKIRFKGSSKSWLERNFKDFIYSSGKKNRDNLPLESFSISNVAGFVPQDEQFENGGTMKNADKRMYFIVSKNSFAYNPARINVGSIGFYEGEEDVIVSSLYEVFKTDGTIDDHFLMKWFKSPAFANLVKLYQEGGVRLYFFFDKLLKCKINCPELNEQKLIYHFLTNIENLISSATTRLASLKQLKVASLQGMFPQEGEIIPKLRFKEFTDEWVTVQFGSLIDESLEKSTRENEDVLLSSAISGVFLNSELFDHQRGKSNIGYRKIKKNMLILSAQNLHLGNANVNLRFNSGLISPAYKIYNIHNILPEFLSHWIKREETKNFFLNATTAGASLCRKNIVWEDLYKQTLLIPSSLEEQRTIASFFTTLDKQIALQSKCLEKLEQIKSACLDKMFV